ncbi:cupin domain-containing protein [Jiulongibacter sp. NS-SX5]|uniref:cupin domain-containing protein n=1 Tax=Jiulongibacter sp. NS-SX5 TaxID=3463854 RepID=UPI0040582FA3
MKEIRRVVTGHTEDGKAQFVIDEHLAPKLIVTGDAAMSTLWTSEVLPADCNDNTDGRIRDAGTTLKGGSVFRVVDMQPGASSPMHRTNSIDYGIVLKGEIDLELDEGQVKRIEEGSVIIQRGTIHRWVNPSQEKVCRILFVLTEAKPFEVNGQPLPEVMEH